MCFSIRFFFYRRSSLVELRVLYLKLSVDHCRHEIIYNWNRRFVCFESSCRPNFEQRVYCLAGVVCGVTITCFFVNIDLTPVSLAEKMFFWQVLVSEEAFKCADTLLVHQCLWSFFVRSFSFLNADLVISQFIRIQIFFNYTKVFVDESVEMFDQNIDELCIPIHIRHWWRSFLTLTCSSSFFGTWTGKISSTFLLKIWRRWKLQNLSRVPGQTASIALTFARSKSIETDCGANSSDSGKCCAWSRLRNR